MILILIAAIHLAIKLLGLVLASFILSVVVCFEMDGIKRRGNER